MSIYRMAARRDRNERPIVEALEAAGATVCRLSEKGAPDLLVGYEGRNALIEVKSAQGKLTEDEQRWHSKWRGQVTVVRTVEEALRLLERLR